MQEIDIIHRIAIASEICGNRMSDEASEIMYRLVAKFDGKQIIGALDKCMMELKGKLTVQDILSRIDDGRPGVNEAYGLCKWDEESSFALTSEMEVAMGAAWAVMDFDKYAAKKAFDEKYVSAVAEARMRGVPVVWRISEGWNPQGRIDALKQAQDLGRIPKPNTRVIEQSRGVPAPPEIAAQIKGLTGR